MKAPTKIAIALMGKQPPGMTEDPDDIGDIGDIGDNMSHGAGDGDEISALEDAIGSMGEDQLRQAIMTAAQTDPAAREALEHACLRQNTKPAAARQPASLGY